jgi:hypothetical protein
MKEYGESTIKKENSEKQACQYRNASRECAKVSEVLGKRVVDELN